MLITIIKIITKIIISIILYIVWYPYRFILSLYIRNRIMGKDLKEQLTGMTEEERYYEQHGFPDIEDRKSTRIFKDEE